MACFSHFETAPFIPDVITITLRADARRVIGATAKPLYPIDGKAGGLDRRIPQTSLFEGGGPPAGGGRSFPTVEGIHDHGTGEMGSESSVPKRMARIASMAILGSRRMDSRPFVSCMTSVNCV